MNVLDMAEEIVDRKFTELEYRRRMAYMLFIKRLSRPDLDRNWDIYVLRFRSFFATPRRRHEVMT